tara:strand:- start:65 stop:1168 length:1104 start_codon:yes stop_codon:yes gene_type:complete
MIIPLSVLYVAVPAATSVAGTIALVIWGGKRKKKLQELEQQRLIELRLQEEREERERKRLALIARERELRQIEAEKRRAEKRRIQEEEARKKYLRALDERTTEMVSHVNLVNTREKVGVRLTGHKAVGFKRVVRPYPTGQWEVRPITPGDFAQTPNLLPQEHTFPKAVKRLRILTGEALIRVPVEDVVITEPVYEPEYRVHYKALYILWDVSPSMWHQRRPDIWTRLLTLLSHKAEQNGVPMYYRCFGSRTGPLNVVTSPQDHLEFRRRLSRVGQMGGTSLHNPLSRMLSDFGGFEYDEGVVVVVSDGEVNEDLTPFIEECKQKRITLHSLMLGTENLPLQEISHTYQTIDDSLVLSPRKTQSFDSA